MPSAPPELPSFAIYNTFCNHAGDEGASPCVDVGGGGIFSVELDVAASVLTATPIGSDPDAVTSTRLAATAALDGGGCWLAGGWDSTSEAAQSDIFRVSADGVAPVTYALTEPRVGANAAVIEQGPLSGAVLPSAPLAPELPATLDPSASHSGAQIRDQPLSANPLLCSPGV